MAAFMSYGMPLIWAAVMSIVPPPPFTPSLDLRDARNSQYVPIVFL